MSLVLSMHTGEQPVSCNASEPQLIIKNGLSQEPADCHGLDASVKAIQPLPDYGRGQSALPDHALCTKGPNTSCTTRLPWGRRQSFQDGSLQTSGHSSGCIVQLACRTSTVSTALSERRVTLVLLVGLCHRTYRASSTSKALLRLRRLFGPCMHASVIEKASSRAQVEQS